MIVEYIRYKIDPSRNNEFDEAYRRAGALLDASPHCQAWEAARCVDEPEKQSSASTGTPQMDISRASGRARISSLSSKQPSRSSRTSRR
jgi:hypothetical protein